MFCETCGCLVCACEQYKAADKALSKLAERNAPFAATPKAGPLTADDERILDGIALIGRDGWGCD
jgi:hypothetical protein